MAILVNIERVFPDGKTYSVPTLYPTGRIVSKHEREQAERLDQFLAAQMLEIEDRLRQLGVLDSNDLRKWHALGQHLQFVDDPTLVSLQDRDSGAVWLAVRQYCPIDLLPTAEESHTSGRTAAEGATDSQRRLGKRHDHFERCYKLGKYDLDQVAWMTWSDFDTFLESPGLERDPRILPLLASRVQKLRRRLRRREFRAVCKALREHIPTKRRERETSRMSNQQLAAVIDLAFQDAAVTPARG